MSAKPDFTHLHVHSEFSLLDGMSNLEALMEETKRLGMDSIALTDHGALYGSVQFVQAAKQFGIKPIIGVETYVARRGMGDKEGKADQQFFHDSFEGSCLCGVNFVNDHGTKLGKP